MSSIELGLLCMHISGVDRLARTSLPLSCTLAFAVQLASPAAFIFAKAWSITAILCCRGSFLDVICLSVSTCLLRWFCRLSTLKWVLRTSSICFSVTCGSSKRFSPKSNSDFRSSVIFYRNTACRIHIPVFEDDALLLQRPSSNSNSNECTVTSLYFSFLLEICQSLHRRKITIYSSGSSRLNAELEAHSCAPFLMSLRKFEGLAADTCFYSAFRCGLVGRHRESRRSWFWKFKHVQNKACRSVSDGRLQIYIQRWMAVREPDVSSVAKR